MPHTPFQARLLRVQNVSEAKALLTDALAQGNREELVHGDYPYDLDLPGMLFPIANRGLRPDEPDFGGLPVEQLGALFADATWEMCREGVLRPGSHSPLDKMLRPSQGFCLTGHGRKVVRGEVA